MSATALIFPSFIPSTETGIDKQKKNRLFEFILFKPFCLTITNKRSYITYRRPQQINNYVILTEKHNTINNYINTLFIYYSSNNIAKRSKMKDQYASMQQAIEYNNMKT